MSNLTSKYFLFYKQNETKHNGKHTQYVPLGSKLWEKNKKK